MRASARRARCGSATSTRAHRWIDALEYRERYFSDAGIEQLRAREPAIAKLSEAVRNGIDEYLAWRSRA